ncbi:hypothetical protein AJ80_05937 [Polytolypa hystricis UAMH7299]|uniref:Uncharacterized protein n=1 Tax=Polytolypa hystricis (strain UAMH7299) TaxID=1447883 RepID=A0A2B7Y0V4_POLH7|nr:hypothetical protein AJ80_05937 [Polytolypa hystricis UAMH7299]
MSGPPSPHKRRHVLWESEDTQGEMSIERYLYASDPFRPTTHPVPFPFPLHLSPSADQSILHHHRLEIIELVSSHGFSQPGIFVEDVTKPNYPGGDIPLKTLLILFHVPEQRIGNFRNARDSLREFLMRHGYNDTHVEIVHQFLCFHPSMFAIDPNHPTANVYKSAKHDILELVV